MKRFLTIPLLFSIFTANAQTHCQRFSAKNFRSKGGRAPFTQQRTKPKNRVRSPVRSFLLDSDGKMRAQARNGLSGGTKDKAGLPPCTTNAFNFVLTFQKPVTNTTNLIAKGDAESSDPGRR